MLLSSSTSSTERCRYSTVKFSIRGWRSTMCREEEFTGQNAEAEGGTGEEDGDDEEGAGASLPAAELAASEWLGGPYMVAWLASLEKPLLRQKNVANLFKPACGSFIKYKHTLSKTITGSFITHLKELF